jgi:O-antigen/teichoic acid export membrane protein
MKKGLIQVMVANIINLAIGLLNSFFLPKYLSVETYAMIKTYTLYISYAGFFHLGYLDGMYLKYGGKKLADVNREEYGSDFGNVLFMESIAGVILAVLAFILHDPIVLAFAFGMLLNNIISCFQMLFQAVGEFKLYSSALNLRSIISFLGSITLLLVFRCDKYGYYIACQVLSGLVPIVYLGTLLNKRTAFASKISIKWSEFKNNISSGFVLMLGNFSSTMFTGIDRWFVKFLLTTADFAVYSFAVSVDSLVTVFITPIAITLYNTLCKEQNINKIKQLKDMILVWGFIVTALAFPAKWVIEHFLVKYIDAVPIIIILFTSQALYAVIKGVYVNLYKARKQQTIYFKQMIAMVILAAALDAVMYLIFKSGISLAVGTLMTAVAWLVINEIKNKEIRYEFKQWIYLVALVGIFIVSGLCLPTIFGFIVYIAVLFGMSISLMREPFKTMIGSVYGMLISKFKRGKNV